MNPQTDISKYSETAVNAYLGKLLGQEMTLCLPHLSTRVIDLYKEQFTNNVLYVQNLGDRYHVPKYLIPFSLRPRMR